MVECREAIYLSSFIEVVVRQSFFVSGWFATADVVSGVWLWSLLYTNNDCFIELTFCWNVINTSVRTVILCLAKRSLKHLNRTQESRARNKDISCILFVSWDTEWEINLFVVYDKNIYILNKVKSNRNKILLLFIF